MLPARKSAVWVVRRGGAIERRVVDEVWPDLGNITGFSVKKQPVDSLEFAFAYFANDQGVTWCLDEPGALAALQTARALTDRRL